ncbi:MAG: hypothetical protein MRZ79_07835, partial [Bacteroidia bacterium]|nr:hypothetical protein [Bacteroidia bacterium]
AIADFSFNSADELHRFVKQKDWLFPKYLSKIIYETTRPNPADRSKDFMDVINDILRPAGLVKKSIFWIKNIFS